ncbi:membrane protein [Vulcaniibacterium thermophilum]|uniref:Membrane protein n=3 Tax=Bacteria TaxID=2 RepID=A0A919DHW1_9GAMM|nr:membrane protein [Vulcaniibacterium thermophilum]
MLSRMDTRPPADRRSTPYAARVEFVVELASHLHAYGTTAQRLEGALVSVASKLGLQCEPWSNPTGMILTFREYGQRPGVQDITRVIRLSPGENDLSRLSEADRIADAVLDGSMDLDAGFAALRALDRPPTRRARALQVFAYMLSAGALAGLLRLPWLDIGVAAVNGLLLGLLVQLAERRPRTKEALEAIAATVAAFVVLGVAALVAPLNQNTVIIASLIVLLPGLALTNAVNELTSQHLVSGTARFAGAATTVLKLAVGVVVAVYCMRLLGLEPQVRAWRPQPEWMEWVALALSAFAFALLFRAARRDVPVVMLAAAGGYLISRFAGEQWGHQAGIFLAALAVTAAGNAFARWAHRPGAIVRLPGIIMLVPGSTSLRGLLTLLQQQDMEAGQDALLTVLNILAALIAGLLFGNLLLPTRRNL